MNTKSHILEKTLSGDPGGGQGRGGGGGRVKSPLGKPKRTTCPRGNLKGICENPCSWWVHWHESSTVVNPSKEVIHLDLLSVPRDPAGGLTEGGLLLGISAQSRVSLLLQPYASPTPAPSPRHQGSPAIPWASHPLRQSLLLSWSPVEKKNFFLKLYVCIYMYVWNCIFIFIWNAQNR